MQTSLFLKITTLALASFALGACSSSPKKAAVEPVAAAANVQPPMKITPRGPMLTLDDVLFDFEQSTLKSESNSIIARSTSYLEANPGYKAIIEGHTDTTGEADYNLNLSKNRAQSVESALVANGISSSRLKIDGLGEAKPASSNDTLAGRQANRRVEITFIRP